MKLQIKWKFREFWVTNNIWKNLLRNLSFQKRFNSITADHLDASVQSADSASSESKN